MKKYIDNFTRRYSVQKTLRFRLIPQGDTRKWIEQNRLLEQDEHRAESYAKLKEIIDRYHKEFLADVLEKVELNLSDIEEYYDLYMQEDHGTDHTKRMEACALRIRKSIMNQISKDDRFKNLFKKELIREELPRFAESEEEQNIIAEFHDFTTYFVGFFKNRENIYSTEAKSTALAYRLINENLLIFFDNYNAYVELRNRGDIPELPKVEEKLKEQLGFHSFDSVFSLESYESLLSQKRISFYNQIIGGIAGKSDRIKGLRQIINEYNQQHKKEHRLPQMKPLKKMILSDRDTLSFVPEKFGSSAEVINSLLQYMEYLMKNVLRENDTDSVQNMIKRMQEYDLRGIYIESGKALTDLSNKAYGAWNIINDCLSAEYDQQYGTPNSESKDQKKKTYFKKITKYSVAELNILLSKYGYEQKLEEYFRGNKEAGDDGSILAAEIEEAYERIKAYASQKDVIDLLSDKEKVKDIKSCLDSVKKLQRYLEIFVCGNDESHKDTVFYAELMRIWAVLEEGDALYNRIRNYVTQKPYSREKIKLNFENSLLLNGWDINKETANTCVLLMKDGLYYLGIMDKQHKKIFEDLPEDKETTGYRKMVYKLLPGPNKMLPKVIFSKKGLETFEPSEDVLRIYHTGSFKKGEAFRPEDCHKLIDFYKEAIEKYEDWKIFEFNFRESEQYNDISEFYNDVAEQGYKVRFQNISENYIEELVSEGKLYLFQIYNKDFSPRSTGKPNLHTMYWKMLFDDENLKHIVYKLNGEAEVFYRKASIPKEKAVIHYADRAIENKNRNNPKKETTFPYDIIKNKRFTEDQFFFHVPITMNFISERNGYLNEAVRQEIHDDPEQYVIGIDRGERNLLYVVMIDSKGEIQYQRSLNEIITQKNGTKYQTDYHELLLEKESKRNDAREQWGVIENIKELKTGYLSLVVHEIIQLMTRYNAIVVLEDLNAGFKRSRQKVERQVYQKFEKMLIDKLNYLVDDKDKAPCEPGGILNAYQLTEKFESFSKLGKQSGMLFYVQAWNTSKIDPTTGFVNLLYPKYESVEKAKDFIRKMDDIRYNKAMEYFEFDVDYAKYTFKANGTKEKWRICSYGERIHAARSAEYNNQFVYEEVNLTKVFKDLFNEYGVALDKDIKEQILLIDEKKFFEQFLHLISLMLKMRNSTSEKAGGDSGTKDYIISPVKNAEGEFFDSRKYDDFSEEERMNAKWPIDADANGAFNIARKGLWLCRMLQNTEPKDLRKAKLSISNKEWLSFVQELTGIGNE